MWHADYRIALISALPIERACAEALLDERHSDLPLRLRDSNVYTLGRIGRHNVVLASLPKGTPGNVSAARVASRIWQNFPQVRFGLMIGVGGGVPDVEHKGKRDIRLGDVIVGKPDSTFGGVVQYRMGKTVPGPSGTSEFKRVGSLNRPPDILLAAVSKLEARHLAKGSEMLKHLSKMMEHYPMLRERCLNPGPERDLLFKAAYNHEEDEESCNECDATKKVDRTPRQDQEPVVHYGTIASADEVMRHGLTRDVIAKDFGILCFEMEAAGLDGDFPCLVIRGICDYADSHKNKEWQPYASATAAAYAKELLYTIPSEENDRKVALWSILRRSQYFFAICILLLAILLGAMKTFPGIQNDNREQLSVSNILFRLDQVFHYQRDGPQIAVIRGMGGQGKSQLALKYCQLKRNAPFQFTFWVDASTEASVQVSLESVASLMEAPKAWSSTQELKVTYVLQTMATLPGRWLLVFDNYDDPGTFGNLRDYFPQGQGGSVLVTSRHADSHALVYNPTQDFIELHGLDEKAAVLLLEQKSGLHGSDLIPNHSRLVVERLGYHPLAITQAGKYIMVQRISIDRFLSHYDRRRETIFKTMPQVSQYKRRLSENEKDTTMNVFTTLELSFQRLESQIGEQGAAIKLLNLFSVFEYNDISEQILRANWRIDFNSEEAEGLDVLESFYDGPVWDSALFRETISAIEDLSLVQTSVTKNGSQYHFSLHPLVRDWIRLRKIHNGSAETSCIVIVLIGSLLRDVDDWCQMSASTKEQLLLHMQSPAIDKCLAELKETHMKLLRERVLNLHFQSGEFTYKIGHRGLAATIFKHTGDHQLEFLGQNHSSTLDSFSRLAEIYTEWGRLEEAELLAVNIFEQRRSTMGESHVDTLRISNTLASNYAAQGRFQEAVDLSKRVTEIAEQTHGKEHWAALQSRQNLAGIYVNLGKWEEAIEASPREMIKQVFGNNSLSALVCNNDLALAYQGLKRWKEAEDLMAETLSIQKQMLGATHLHTLTSVLNLGLLFLAQERWEEAEMLVSQAMEQGELALGEYHPVTLASIESLVAIREHQRRWAEAEQLAQKALAGRVQVFGRDHKRTLAGKNALMRLYLKQGKVSEAQALQ
ncbi:hypothetical protein FH972_024956 [Carpinus fangiana]|uniref:NB-ARC domain-containing protein n=1 Tax=Carpinus fangiana TaxID=176857 RepID=A0A5N6KZM3_9ROSI|nr:hypothetical protein FH972_024956 [Carpinus fangiana]